MATLITDEELNKLVMMCPDEKEPYSDPSIMINKDGTQKYAYVTLVMLGDLYIAGAIVLAHSIRKSGSIVDLVVLVTPDVSEEGKQILRSYFTHVINVKYVNIPNWRTKKQQHKKYLELVFTKFHVFNLVQYEKILLIDADALILKYPDHLFSLNAPAGCFLENKDYIISYDKEGNYVLPKSGVFEWYNKYCGCCKHGNKVPKEMTDRVRHDSKNSGIGGGFILLEPKKGEFESIMGDVTKYPMKQLIENKFVWPEQQYLTLRYSGKWSSVNPRFFGLQGYPHWKILYGLQYGGDKPFMTNSKFDIKTRIQYPDFVLWHQYYGEILEKHPTFATSKVLSQSNELHPYFHSSIKAQKNLLSKMSNVNTKNEISTIQKVLKIKSKISRDQIDYFFLDKDTEYIQIRMKPMWNDIKEYDYFRPIIRLASYFGDTSYYGKIIKLYSEFYANIVGRLDEQFPVDVMDPVDMDLIMLEYIKCRQKTQIITFWSSIVQKITFEKLNGMVNKYGNVTYAKTITLTKHALFNLMFWMYNELTFGSRFDIITQQIKHMQFSDSNDITIIIFESVNDRDNLKKNIMDDIVTYAKFNSAINENELFHITEYFYQVVEYGKIFLNENTLDLLGIQNINNIISPHCANTNLKIQTLKKWCECNLSQLESERLVMFDEIVLYSHGFRNIDTISNIFISVNNDESQSEQELSQLIEDTKMKFLNIKTEKFLNKEIDKVLSHFDIDNLLELNTDPRCHFYFQGIKCILLQYEIVRKIFKNKKIDQADFIMLTTLYPEIITQYVQLHNEVIEFKINNKSETMTHEHIKILLKLIYKKYLRDDLNNFRKLMDDKII